jgi:hypothetical protein
LDLAQYPTEGLVSAFLVACDGYDQGNALPMRVLESLQAAEWRSLGTCCQAESGDICTLLANHCATCTATSCPSVVSNFTSKLPGVPRDNAGPIFAAACQGYLFSDETFRDCAERAASSGRWEDLGQCCVGASDIDCEVFRAICTACTTAPDGDACMEIRWDLGATASEMALACREIELMTCAELALFVTNSTVVGECCAARRGTEVCEEFATGCALCYSDPSSAFCAFVLGHLAVGISAAEFRSACDALADPVANCVQSAFAAGDWPGLGKCCVGVTEGQICQQFIDSCRECSADPLGTTDCSTLITGVMWAVQMTEAEAVSDFQAAYSASRDPGVDCLRDAVDPSDWTDIGTCCAEHTQSGSCAAFMAGCERFDEDTQRERGGDQQERGEERV